MFAVAVKRVARAETRKQVTFLNKAEPNVWLESKEENP